MRSPTIVSKFRRSTVALTELSIKERWDGVFWRYREILRGGLELTDPCLISTVLKACPALSFNHGESVHARLLKQGLKSFTSIQNSILDFYSKCGALGSAAAAFSGMGSRDCVSWNIMIRGFLDEGALEEGFRWFREARIAGFEPNTSTLVLLVQACRCSGAFYGGLGLHSYLVKAALGSELPVRNSLLGMYAENGIEHALKLFDEMPDKDVISWSVVIGAYLQNEEAQLALLCFGEMVCGAVIEPDEVNIVSVLKACGSLCDIGMGRLVHGLVACRGLDFDLFVGNSLIDMYSKCGDTASALKVFLEMPHRNYVSWNSIMSGFVHNGRHAEALGLFDSMRKAGFELDGVALVSLLQTCKHFVEPLQCKLLHCIILRRGYEVNELVFNSLLDAYAKCDFVELAWRLFCGMVARDVVSWSTMIDGFTHSGKPDEAIAVFRKMSKLVDEKPNRVLILNLLEACSVSAELTWSEWAHGVAIRRGWGADVAVGTAILDMYSKCGAVEASRQAFDQIPHKTVVSWSAMISAYGMNGLPKDALSLFAEMKLQHGVKPNPVTALSVLAACSHGGLVDEGLHFFNQMVQDEGIEPNLEHYACVVDMLGRAGKLEPAMDLIRKMPEGLEPSASLWGAMLSACRSHGDGELAEGALSHVLELEPSSLASYMLASNIHAAAGLWANAAQVRSLARERGVRGVAGYSSVRVNNVAYRFVAGDESHPLTLEVLGVVRRLHMRMRMEEGEEVVSENSICIL